jgi:replicative DNA helicase
MTPSAARVLQRMERVDEAAVARRLDAAAAEVIDAVVALRTAAVATALDPAQRRDLTGDSARAEHAIAKLIALSRMVSRAAH